MLAKGSKWQIIQINYAQKVSAMLRRLELVGSIQRYANRDWKIRGTCTEYSEAELADQCLRVIAQVKRQ